VKIFDITIILFALTCLILCDHQLKFFYPADNQNIHYTGRIDFSNPRKPRLSGAGSYFQCKFSGSTCDIFIEDQNLNNYHNYLAIVIDGAYLGRLQLNKNQNTYSLAQNLKDTVHTLLVSKATESQIGYVDFLGLTCKEILPFEKTEKRKMSLLAIQLPVAAV